MKQAKAENLRSALRSPASLMRSRRWPTTSARRGFTLIEILIAVIVIIIVIAVIVAILWLLSNAADTPDRRCTTEANLFVSVIEGDPATGGKIVWICPGERAYVFWNTVDAASASISPSIGDVETEGTMPLELAETTQFELLAVGSLDDCTDTDQVAVRIIADEDELEKTLNPPERDRETGFPADLIWSGTVSEAFVSPNIYVTRIELLGACDWNDWVFRKTDTDNTVHTDIGVKLSEPTDLDEPFPLAGLWEATPINTPPVAIADCPVQFKVTVVCRSSG